MLLSRIVRRTLSTAVRVLVSVGAMAVCRGVDAPHEKFLAAFAPFDGGPVSVSPDGQHIAYVRREKGEAAVYITTIDGSQIAFRAVIGKEDRKRNVGETSVTDPIRVSFLRWADNRHVVV